MKLCMFTDAWAPIWGGGQEHVWQVSQRLTKNYGCQVDIVVPNLGPVGKYQRENLHVIPLGSRFIFPNIFGRLAFLFSAAWYMLWHKYDVYHSHSYSTSLLVLLHRGKFIFTLHGVGKSALGIKLPLEKLGDYVLYGLTYDALLTAAKSSIKPGHKAVVMGNGVDVAEFDKEKAKPDSKYFTVLCVSRRDPVKGIDILEKAIKIVQKKYPNVRLNLVSGRRRTAQDFKMADLYVLPSLSEGFPIVLLEAMAAKLPIVATDVGDCKKLIDEAKAGLVVPPGIADALVKAITSMIENKNQRLLGQNGCDFVKKHYTWEKVAQKVYAVYQKVLTVDNYNLGC